MQRHIIAACLPTIRPLFVNVIEGVKSVKSLDSSQKSGYPRRSSLSKDRIELHNVSSTSNLKGQDGVANLMHGDDVSSIERQDLNDTTKAGAIRKTIRMEVASGYRHDKGNKRWI